MRSQPCYVSACRSCVMYSAWNPKDNYDMRPLYVDKSNLLCYSLIISSFMYIYIYMSVFPKDGCKK